VAKVEDLDPTSSRAVAEYLSVLDDAGFGGASPSEPKAISPVDPAARYTAAANSAAVYAYSDNYLVDLNHAVIMDVQATTAIRQAEVGAAKTMLDRTAKQFDVQPSRLVANAGYGSAEMLGWLVDERGIEPHVKLIDMSERTDGTFSRSDFAYDAECDLYVCPAGRSFANAAACSLRCDRTSPRTARSFTAPANSTAPSARSGPNAARTCPRARSRALFMKPLATRRAQLPRPKPTLSHAANGRESRCFSLT
jgi:hypothetical protein